MIRTQSRAPPPPRRPARSPAGTSFTQRHEMRSMNSFPELLAPAATVACARAAFDHGADAVYIGVGPYSLRSRSGNATIEELGDLLCTARKFGRRVYVALNTMPTDTAIPGIETLVSSIAGQNILPDAFIVSDPGVISVCRARAPHVALHLSTQTGTFNSAAARFWAGEGISRIVLPRELSLAQIAVLCESAHCEMEVFVHGAMCVSISGRCLLGVYTGKRHPNQGDCRQPCRFSYRVSPMYDNRTETGEWFSVEEHGPDPDTPQRAFLLNSKDLCCIDILDKIVSSGVASIKIEGRNRSEHYVSSVVKVYRAALDSIARGEPYGVLPEWREELERLDHPPYTNGFYGGEYLLQDVDTGRPLPHTRIVGVVRERVTEAGAIVDVKNPFDKGDTLNVLPLSRKKMPFEIMVKSIKNMEGNNVERALTNRIVAVQSEPGIAVGDLLRKDEEKLKR